MIKAEPDTKLDDRNAKIYVAGHRGLVGSATVRKLARAGYRNLLLRNHAELDLRDQGATRQFFAQERPEYVILAAAQVGGIYANATYPADFIFDNLAIYTNVVHEAYRVGVKRLIFFGSSCIYPRLSPQPIREEYLLTAELELTNRPNAIAKIAGIEICWAYNQQYGTQFVALMPTNLYGPADNYDPENSHVVPALLRKVHQAKTDQSPTVTIWGTGTPRREFLYSDDVADACIHVLELPQEKYHSLVRNGQQRPLLNVGCGEDITIRELAELISQVVGYQGKLVFDTSKPDGTPRKLLDVSRLQNLGWRARTSLVEGLQKTYADYLADASAAVSGCQSA